MRMRFWIGVGCLAVAAILFAYRGSIVGYVSERWDKRELPAAVSYEEVREEVAAGGDNFLLRNSPPPEADRARRPLPEATPAPRTGSDSPRTEITPPTATSEGEGYELTAEFNLAVPFTVQAPFAVWDELHEDACEEASVMMVDAFYKGRTFTPGPADQEIMAIVDWETQVLGHWEDATADETARILREKYGYSKVSVFENPSIDDIKREIVQGHPIIVPAAGRLLGNRYFTPPGPVYHMLVVRGWTKDGMIITNDPGTKRGEGYLYKQEVLMNAIHDWTPPLASGGGTGSDETIEQGRKVMIVVEK